MVGTVQDMAHEKPVNKLIEALEAAYGFSKECGLTEEQEKILGEHIEKLKALDFAEAETALIEAQGSIDNHSYRHYTPAKLDQTITTLCRIRDIFEGQ